MGEIHELFVLALSLVWFAGATQAVLDGVPPTGLQLLRWERVLLMLWIKGLSTSKSEVKLSPPRGRPLKNSMSDSWDGGRKLFSVGVVHVRFCPPPHFPRPSLEFSGTTGKLLREESQCVPILRHFVHCNLAVIKTKPLCTWLILLGSDS